MKKKETTPVTERIKTFEDARYDIGRLAYGGKEDIVNSIYERALDIYGIESQEWVLIEECGELIDVIAKHKRGRASDDDILTELADVHIIVEQMAMYLGLENFYKEKARKLQRLNERLQIKSKMM